MNVALSDLNNLFMQVKGKSKLLPSRWLTGASSASSVPQTATLDRLTPRLAPAAAVADFPSALQGILQIKTALRTGRSLPSTCMHARVHMLHLAWIVPHHT